MPQNNPGSLSQQQTLAVTTFVLLQNGFVQPGTTIDQSTLSSIPLQ